MVEHNNLVFLVMGLTTIFILFWFVFKFTASLSYSSYSTRQDYTSLMKRKEIILRLITFLFKLIVGIAWFVVFVRLSNVEYNNEIRNAVDRYVLFSTLAISILNTALFVSTLRSLKKLIIGLNAMFDQRKNTVYNNLLRAIDGNDPQAIIFNYKLLKLNSFYNKVNPRSLTENYWLIVFSALVREDEEEARKLADVIGGDNVTKHSTPIKKDNLSIKSFKTHISNLIKGKKHEKNI
ncbi:hypothetical protein [Staphylococcus succinus]|uniref:hypothetical protein n=1 Tax=Staphylococcus succinus TaxID=61015 RepID=UPI000E6A0F25|nr:hypothetical protein [Staphylococcus succinus]RIN27744.1 hypothetical protein BU067_01675 [Staphylococcus succinus]